MPRLSRDELDNIKAQYQTDTIWSWSRINTFAEHPWEYYLKYLKKVGGDTNNIYTIFGTIVHDLIQSVYEHGEDPEKLLELFNEAVFEWQIGNNDYQFLNDNVEQGYIQNIRHYFEHPQLIQDIYPGENVEIELPIQINFERDGQPIVFIGYIDCFYKDVNGDYIIMDLKTSSKGKFTGKSLKESSRQLLLYAIGVHQKMGIPYDNIKLRFDMVKYINVGYLQKNGKWKFTLQERMKWVKTQDTKIRSLLIENGVDLFEADDMVNLAIDKNDISGLPDYVKDNFKLEKGYIDVEVDEAEAAKLEEWIVGQVESAIKKSNGDWESEFPEPTLDPSNSFYYTQLASWTLDHHQAYQEEQAIKRARGLSADDDLDELFW